MANGVITAVISVTGTSNQIGSTGGLYPVITIANNPVLPGSAGVTLPQGNTAARGGAAGTIRFNTQTSVFEATTDGASWSTFATSTGAVTSVSGTSNRIIVSPTTGDVVVDISASYVGQSSITTLGTITTGVWHGTTIGSTYGGSGVSNPTAHGILIAEGSSAFTPIVLSAGQILIGTTASDPSAATISSGTGINVTSSSGSISVANTGVLSNIATANQTTVSGATGNVTIGLASNAVLPGTGGVTLPQGNTAARAGAAGTIRFNTQTTNFESTADGATWAIIETSATGVTSVSGTSNRITASPTTGDVIVDISASYVGQASITTLGTITTGTWSATAIDVTHGGTGLTSTTINQILYSSNTNTIAGLATANNGVLTTGTSGTPVITALASDGQLIIGSSIGAPAAATITAGTGISITNGHNSITIASNGALVAVDQTTTPVTLVANTEYSANNAGLVTFNMPATVPFGTIFVIRGYGAGGWLVQMNTGQVANLGNSPTSSAGSLASTNRYDAIEIFCSVANTTFTACAKAGNITVA